MTKSNGPQKGITKSTHAKSPTFDAKERCTNVNYLIYKEFYIYLIFWPYLKNQHKKEPSKEITIRHPELILYTRDEVLEGINPRDIHETQSPRSDTKHKITVLSRNIRDEPNN